MKPNKLHHGLIFEGYTEARIASSLFAQSGNDHLAEAITPNVPNRELTIIEFIRLFSPYKRSQNRIEFSTPPELAIEMLTVLGNLAIPSDVFTQKLSPEHAAGKMLSDFIPLIEESAPYSVIITGKF